MKTPRMILWYRPANSPSSLWRSTEKFASKEAAIQVMRILREKYPSFRMMDFDILPEGESPLI